VKQTATDYGKRAAMLLPSRASRSKQSAVKRAVFAAVPWRRWYLLLWLAWRGTTALGSMVDAASGIN